MPDERPPTGACPFLGLAADPPSRFDFPSSEHRCRSAAPPVYVELAHQGTYCLTSRHVSCARYVGPDAVVAGGAPQVAAPPATPREGTPSQPPPEARASYTLAARGGFGALAATPRGWVPVETSTPVAAAGVAADAAAPAESELEPAAAEPAPADAEPEPAEPAPDSEGLGALVAAGATADAAADAPALPGTTADAPSVEVPAAEGLASNGAAEGAGAGTEALDAGDGTAGLEGPAALEGTAAGPGIGARLAGIGRHLLRGLAILLAAVLVLAALVGLGYGAGKLLVRPGESLPSSASTPDPATPLVTPPGSGSSEAPGAGAATTPPLPGASATPVPSTPAAATARPTPTAKPTPRATLKPRVYVVKSGDTLFAIAERFGVTVSAIIAANDITDPNAILPGQRLTIPRP